MTNLIKNETVNEVLKVSSDPIYSFLTSQFLNQEQLSWNRTQTIVAVEAGLLASSFALQGIFGVASLLFGSILIWLIWCLILRDWEVRDQNFVLLDSIHKQLGIRLICEPKFKWRRGRIILKSIVYFLIFINIILSLYFFKCPISKGEHPNQGVSFPVKQAVGNSTRNTGTQEKPGQIY